MMRLGLFARRARGLDQISHAPVDAVWCSIVSKPQPAVRAWLAAASCDVRTAHGVLRALAGRDFVVAHDTGDHGVVRGDIFQKTYEPLGGGLYRKRTDICLRYFTLNKRVLVETLECLQIAEPGDWIVEGVEGELWPVSPEKGEEKYHRIQ